MKVLLFAGTAEGREEAERLLSGGHDVTACVTTEYGAALLPPGARRLVGALDEEGMAALMARLSPDAVVDATHPYARQASENIRRAAERAGLPVRRVVRAEEAGAWRRAVLEVEDAAAAAEALRGTEGNVLLTTGSHALSAYSALDSGRLYARVLPTHEALDACAAAGLAPSHVVAMHGPFSRALNGALYDQYGIRHLVTKDGGARGGLGDKVVPALERGVRVILIRRPEEG